MKKFSYYDSEGGEQGVSFSKLSELIKYIEDFEPEGESIGTIYDGERPILNYASNEQITWEPHEN